MPTATIYLSQSDGEHVADSIAALMRKHGSLRRVSEALGLSRWIVPSLARGTGSTERAAGGRRRVRLVTPAGRISLGVVDSQEAAEALLAQARAEIVSGECQRGLTLHGWGQRWLERRELEGYRSIADARRIWRLHVEQDSIADLPLASIKRIDVIEWIGRVARKRAANGPKPRRLSRQRAQNILNILRASLGDACHRGVLVGNPAVDVRVPRREREEATRDPWTYLKAEEQAALWACADVPQRHRLWMQFAVGTGLRSGEQFNLRLPDLRVEDPDPE